MKLYYVESGTADNYIMSVSEDGVCCDNCAPDGMFAGISLVTTRTEKRFPVSSSPGRFGNLWIIATATSKISTLEIRATAVSRIGKHTRMSRSISTETRRF